MGGKKRAIIITIILLIIIGAGVTCGILLFNKFSPEAESKSFTSVKKDFQINLTVDFTQSAGTYDFNDDKTNCDLTIFSSDNITIKAYKWAVDEFSDYSLSAFAKSRTTLELEYDNENHLYSTKDQTLENNVIQKDYYFRNTNGYYCFSIQYNKNSQSKVNDYVKSIKFSRSCIFDIDE